jgi:HEAT repeat protein
MSRLVVLVVCGALLLLAANAQEPDDPVVFLIGQLNGKDPTARRRAAKDLGRRGGEQAIRALSQALGDNSESVRHEAAIALARLAPDNPRVVEVLIESLKNEDWYVRWQACLAVRSVGPSAKRAVPDLLRLLRDSKQDVCRESTLALAAIAPRDEKVVAALVSLLDAKHPVDLHAVLFALEASGPRARAAVPWIVRELKGGRPDFRGKAMRVLRAARPVGVADLSELLGAPALAVRVFAARELGRLGRKAKAAIPALVRLVIDPEPSVQRSATCALAGIEPGLIVSAGEWTYTTSRLGRVVESGTRRGVVVELPSHRHCARLLALLRDKEVGDKILSALVQLPLLSHTDLHLASGLEDESEVKRECAALLLGWLARDKREAQSRLRAARGDKSVQVRKAVEEALRRLDGG